MSGGFLFSPSSTCQYSSSSSVSISPTEDGLSVRPRSPRSLIPSSSIVVIMAMRISRARWYSFLRRVFHYQNGSRSDLGSNPFDSSNWMAIELVSLIAQLVVITNTMAISKDERPVWPMRIWLSGYGLGCGLSLLLLHYRFQILSNSQPSEEPRNTRSMNKCRTWLELFFAIWFVMGNVWLFDARVGSFHRSPKLHVLCVSLLTLNAISYSFPFVLFVLLCCIVPVISTLVGYNMNMSSLDRGATKEQISKLLTWRFKKSDGDLEHGELELSPDEESPECCICLAKYKEKEEIRQLTCLHMFHLKCVDQWLRISSCCPLCKQELDK